VRFSVRVAPRFDYGQVEPWIRRHSAEVFSATGGAMACSSDWHDDRMIRTVDAIIAELVEDGLVRRYSTDDGLPGREGAFLCCSFWLVETLARQDRHDEARHYFDHALATANGLGLFAEQYDPAAGEMRGNFPQALSHLAHVEAALALADRAGAAGASDGFRSVTPLLCVHLAESRS